MVSNYYLLEFLRTSPIPSILLRADTINFEMEMANAAYLKVSGETSDLIQSKKLYEIFPFQANEGNTESQEMYSRSFAKVIATREIDILLPRRYDILDQITGLYKIHYWEPQNIPILNEEGNIEYILHIVVDVTAQTQLTPTLEATSPDYRDLLQIVPNIIWEADTVNHHYTFVSPQSKSILGYSPEGMCVPEFWINHLHPHDRNIVLEYSANKIKHQENYTVEYRMISADNSEVWINDAVRIINLGEGIFKLRGVMTDITVRKQAERKEKEKEAKITSLLENSLDVICTIDKSGKFTEVSAAAQMIWGYSPKELIGKDYQNFVYQEDKAITAKTEQELILGLTLSSFENRYTRKDGSLAIMVWSAKWNEKDQLFYCIGKDNSVKKQIEIDLYKSENRYKSLLQHGSEFISVLDINAHFIYASPNVKAILGWEADHLIGTDSFSLVHPQDLDRISKLFQQLASGINMVGDTIQYKALNGNYHWMELMAIDMRDNPAIEGILINSSDITEKKRYMEWHEYVHKATKNAIFDWDIPKGKVQWGGNTMQFFNINPDNGGVLITDWADKIHPDDIDHILLALDDVHSSPDMVNWNIEYRHYSPEEEYIMVEEDGYIIRNNEGDPIRMFGAIRDISERKLYELTLSSSNQRFELASQASSDAIWDWDLETQKVHRGPGYKTLFGFDVENKLLSSNWWKKKIHPADAKRVNKHLDEIILSKKSNYENEYRFQKADGEYTYVLDKALIVRDANGKAIRMVGAMHDIQQDKLQKLEDHLKLSISSIFSNDNSLDANLKQTLKVILKALDFKFGEIWMIANDDSSINLRAQYGIGTITISDNLISFEKGIGVPGKIWRDQKPVFIEDIQAGDNFVRRGLSMENKLKSVVGYPILHNETVIAVILLYLDEKNSTNKLRYLSQDILTILSSEIRQKKAGIEFNQFFDLSPDYLVILDKAGNYIKGNLRFMDLKEYNIEENLRDNFLPYEIYSELKSGRTTFHESSYKNSTNDPIWISWTTSPITEEGYFFAIGKDSTERKKNEEGLVSSHQNILNILESIKDGFFSITKDWIVTYWNKEAESILGIPRDLILNKNLWDVFPEAIKLRFFTEYERAITENIPVRFEEHFPPLNLWLAVSAFPSGTGLTVYFNDISERKNASQELLQFKQVIENSKDEIAIFSTTNDSIYINPAYTTSLGYPREKLKEIGGPAKIFADQEKAEEIFSTLMRGEHWKGDVELINSTKQLKSYYISAGPIFDDEKKLVAVFIVHTDISHRQITERKVKILLSDLQHEAKKRAILNTDLDLYANTASKELYEPLRLVEDNLRILEQSYAYLLDEKVIKHLYQARKGSEQMRNLLTHLDEYARVGNFNGAMEKIDLNDVLKSVDKILRKQIVDKFAILDIPKLPVIKGHKSHLIKIFENLIGNSLSYSLERPKISITFTSGKTHWLFSVIDNGTGFDPRYAEKVFNLFETLDHQHDRVGNGMGLAITKKLVEKYKGRIWAETDLGKGSIFHFTIAKDV